MTGHILLFVDYKENSIRPFIKNALKNKFQLIEGQDYEFHNICEGKEYVRFFVYDETFAEIREQIKKHPHKLKYEVLAFPESREVFGVSLPINWQRDYDKYTKQTD